MLMPMLPQTLLAQTQSTPEAAGEASPATLKGSANPEVLPSITVQAPSKPQRSRQPLKRNITAQSSHQRSASNLSAGLKTSPSGAPNAGSGPVGPPNMASQITIAGEELNARPVTRPGEILEAVPGLIVTQHSGDGKANQYFLRGFNLDHGTDFLTTIDHMPVNMPTHAHGQGYSDINFLLPELVSRVAYKKGPYFAEDGDFSSAGAADIDYYTKMPRGVASLGFGSDGYRRAMAADSFDAGPGHLLYGFELFHNDGPWINPEDYRKLNGVLRFSEGTNADGYTVSLMGYTGKWNATDQIPQRAVDDGTISRFGAIDPTDGGRTSRYSLSLDRHKTLENGGVFHMDVYAIKYRLDLFSNFTFFLDHPFPVGDQFEQADNRTIVGVTPSWVFTGRWDERQMS